MTCGGVGRSGLPMPRSITSSPARRAACASCVTCANTYGGSRRSLWKSWRMADTAAPGGFGWRGRRRPKLREIFPGGKPAEQEVGGHAEAEHGERDAGLLRAPDEQPARDRRVRGEIERGQ